MNTREYDFPDVALLAGNPIHPRFMIWNPGFTCLVLGFGNNPERSVHWSRVKTDRIPVYKRPSGGETVLLSPGTMVISIILPRSKFESIKKYFARFNTKIIRALEKLGVRELYLRGISDISIREQKIAGSAVYQNREKIFYHTVLNISETGDTIEKYIKHPSKVPDYRKNRSHRDFVTSLYQEGYRIEIKEIKNALSKEFLREEDFKTN